MPNAIGKARKPVFFADLDNTLIYSHRHKYEGEIIWAEYSDGKKQAFIPLKAYNFLKEFNVEIVPVTSRSQRQYSRLAGFLSGLGVRRALIYNGAYLTGAEFEKSGEVRRYNERMLKESERCADAMERAFKTVSELPGVRSLHTRMPQYISAAFEGAPRTAELERLIEGEPVYSYTENNKLYIMPENITKGRAVSTFCALFGVDFKICAGDSDNDLPMLNIADIAIFPESLKTVCGKNCAVGSGFYIDKIIDELRNTK